MVKKIKFLFVKDAVTTLQKERINLELIQYTPRPFYIKKYFTAFKCYKYLRF